MLLNFQKQFALKVWQGDKRQTIRAAGHRKGVPDVGQVAHCYTGLRTRNTQLLGRWVIEVVQVIRFDLNGQGIHGLTLAGEPVGWVGFEALAKADGFAGAAAMGRWFAENHEPGEFYGWVVGWRWSAEGAAPTLRGG
jgi:hypothetical protein